MAIPTGTNRRDINLTPPGNEVLDAEPDGVPLKRLLWTGGLGNPLVYADVDPLGMPLPGMAIAPSAAPYAAGNTFPNGAEWGLMTPPAGPATPIMGCFFSAWTLGVPATLNWVDPLGAFGGVPVIADPFDNWLYDAWRVLGVPMIMYRQTTAGLNPILSGQFLVHDPVSGASWPVPNITFSPSNTRGRVMRIVEEHLAAIFPLFTSRIGPANRWRLIWQTLDPIFSNLYMAFGQSWAAPRHVPLGVGVRKLTHHAWDPQFDWSNDGYFVYDLRRDMGAPYGPVDYIDYYILDYDSAVPSIRVLLADTVALPPVVGPGGVIFQGIGDDENYIDPIGNPTIALTLVRMPGDDANTTNGLVALFNVSYAFPQPPASTTSGVVGSFHVLTPAPPFATPNPRKDPEPMQVGGAVYIYNRERLGPGGLWQMHRTLAWIP